MAQRRRTYRAHGRINPYMSSPCHIELVLKEREAGVKAEKVGCCERGRGGPGLCTVSQTGSVEGKAQCALFRAAWCLHASYKRNKRNYDGAPLSLCHTRAAGTLVWCCIRAGGGGKCGRLRLQKLFS
eukprot:456345-Pelagomonas_calceolata.AAC.2